MDKYTIRQEMMKEFILLERTIDRMGIVGINDFLVAAIGLFTSNPGPSLGHDFFSCTAH